MMLDNKNLNVKEDNIKKQQSNNSWFLNNSKME